MPTSESQASPVDFLVLAAACVFAGLALGFATYLAGCAMRASPVAAVAAIGEAQRQARRRVAAHGSLFHGTVMPLVAFVLPLVRSLPLDTLRATLATRYARAGWPGGLDDDELLAISLLGGLLLALPVMAVLAGIKPVAAPLAVILVLLGPGIASALLAGRGARRQLEISRTMPFVLDLLVLTVRAGASLTIALERVATDYARHPIGVEFRAILRDLELGSTIREALENLAQRVPVAEVRTFVDELIQAEELGRPLADTLARAAGESRTRRLQRAIDLAGRAKVKVLIPGTLILLACLLVLFAPFVARYFYGGYGGI